VVQLLRMPLQLLPVVQQLQLKKRKVYSSSNANFENLAMLFVLLYFIKNAFYDT
jgi:hypothetical protein